MSNLEIIQTLCEMLDDACGIIRDQSEIMSQHGILTDDGGLEERRDALLRQVEREGWVP